MTRTEKIILFSLIAAKLIFHFAIAGNYELHRDALLYAALGDHPAWGYASVPPLIGFISNVSRFMLGDNAFAFRFFPAIAGVVAIFLVIKIVKELKGGTFAVLLAGLAYLFSVAYLRTNSLFQPVSFNQLFWLMSFYFVVRLINTGNPLNWIWLGITWGFAALNKYSIGFLAVSMILAILISDQRKFFFNWYFPAGMLIAAMIVLPNVIWQFNHNWPIVKHMTELQETQLVNVSIGGFLGMQLIMNAHALIIWVSGLIIMFTRGTLKKFRFIAYSYLIALLILILLRGKAYYTLGLYPVLFAAGAVALEIWLAGKLNFLRYVIIILMIITTLPFIPYSAPVLKPEKLIKLSEKLEIISQSLLTWEDGKIHELPQDFADMRGWKELANITYEAWNSLDEREQENAVVFAGNYGMAGAVEFYNWDTGVPEPISFNDNFIIWAPDSLKLDVFIYLDYETEDLDQYFEKIELFGKVRDQYFREYGLCVFICRHPVNNFEGMYAELAGELKSAYRRK